MTTVPGQSDISSVQAAVGVDNIVGNGKGSCSPSPSVSGPPDISTEHEGSSIDQELQIDLVSNVAVMSEQKQNFSISLHESESSESGL